jgi:hypothetical protein
MTHPPPTHTPRSQSPIVAKTPTARTRASSPVPRTVRLLLVCEGGHDIAFLKRISRMLHEADSALPDLGTLEQSRQIALIPIGGSNVAYWTDRLAGLGISEWHLYDHEVEPLATERRALVATINQRPGCSASLTSKRSLENYLHPAAIQACRAVDVAFGDWDDVPDRVAERSFIDQGGPAWRTLCSRTKRRLRHRAKHWLNRAAVERMTLQMLAVRDPAGDIRRWLTTIADIVRGADSGRTQPP